MGKLGLSEEDSTNTDKLELAKEIVKAAADVIENHAGKTYDNLTKKPSKALGTNIADIVNLVFSPFRYFNQKAGVFYAHKLETYQKELEEKEKSVPEEKRIEPDFHLVSLALDNSKFCITNDDLRHMFVNLIGSAMNLDTANSVHPAFAEMIKQMNSTDAKVLETFSKNYIQPIVNVHLIVEGTQILASNNLFVANDSGHGLSLADNLSASITNLNRLGLVNIDYTKVLNSNGIYKPLEELAGIGLGEHSSDPNAPKIRCEKGAVSITTLGKNFLKICLSD